MKKALQLPFLKRNKARIQFSNSSSILILLFSFLSSAYSQNIGINTTGATPNSKVLLDINADNLTGVKKGLLIPRMTTIERNTLSSTGVMIESLLIYNTTTQCFEAWNETTPGWVAFGCLNCQLPGAFNTSAASNIGFSYFTANWSVSAGASSYYLDVSTSSSFATFVTGFENLPVSMAVSYLAAGLTASTTYYYRVRAVNECGVVINSATTTLTTLSLSALSAGCDYTQNEAAYGTFVTYAGKTWITRNLGATAQATAASSTINAEAGCYFQFNRSQAYGHDNGGTVNPAWTITTITEGSDWLISNDPCRLQLGGFWRLPTYTEWTNVVASGAWTGSASSFGSVLKIHEAGNLNLGTGSLEDRGGNGVYWSSSQISANTSWALNLLVTPDLLNDNPKTYGFTVRCLK